ncbi:type II toxin-antitoxin system VapC family toxin [Oryzicola mucosus]|uniref:Ribonuclease VapC n=1 Tax=Oryzicola mucosus TaxID=2767425 RepID=A0A8J6PXV6_9HYPH|nr:type II toxin-antitoxin system VapC family toxin [Oryzicola mucosus]MBD0416222.1 type II toxin-antitoxin system VapC family toxin [Oryzicola mucosus]
MTRYLLDTNIVSHIIRGDNPRILERLIAVPMDALAISTVTEGELLYGLAKRGHPSALAERVNQLLLRVATLDWGRKAAASYGELRAACQSKGISLSALDMMIAAHARSLEATLVTADRAFAQIPRELLTVENWAEQ